MRPVISWQNWLEVPGVSLTASSEAPGLGINHLLTPQVGEVWRSAAGGALTLDMDMGFGRDVGMIALAAPRSGLLPFQHDTVRVQLSNVSAGGSEVLDTGDMSFDAPNGVWALPISAGIAQNRIPNPSCRDSAALWTVTSQNGNATVSQAPATFDLFGVGGGRLAQDTGSPGWMAAGRQISTTAAAGEEWQASVWVSPQRCTARLVLRFRDASFNITDFSAPSIPSVTWTNSVSRYRSAWRRLTVRGVAPAGRPILEMLVLGEAPSTVPVLFFSEAVTSRAERVANPPPAFAGHVVPLLGGRDSASTLSARFVRLSMNTARPYLQLGRVWVGPAWVPDIGAENLSAGLLPTGFSDSAPVSGQRFFEPGATLRKWSAEMSFLNEDDARILGDIGRFCGAERQIVAMQSAERWRETALFGHFEEPPAPQIQTFDIYPASFSVKEDQ